MSLRVVLLFATTFAFMTFTAACETVEPQKEVTREVTVIQEAPVPPAQDLVPPPKKDEAKKDEVKKDEPKEGGKVGGPAQKYEDLPSAAKEKLPEEAKQEIKQKVPPAEGQ